MPSPFPGMDPWLEQRKLFPGFHNSFIAKLCDELNRHLPPQFYADTATRVLVQTELGTSWREPDVSVLNTTPHDLDVQNIALFAANPRAVVLELPDDDVQEWLIEVRQADDSENLVTAIELLSPSNKAGDRTAFCAKQRGLLQHGVNLVEIDFLRGGQHSTNLPLEQALLNCERFDYHIVTTLAAVPTRVVFYPVTLQQDLPTIAIPLHAGAAPVNIQLQTVMNETYDAGVFLRRIDYSKPPEPPLNPEQQAWVNSLLQTVQ